jgi:hypothetical protein
MKQSFFKKSVKAKIALALLVLGPSLSHAKTLEELLVEKGIITQGEAANTSTSGAISYGDSSTGMAPKVYYSEGTRIDFPDPGFSMKIRTMLQSRYSFNDEENSAPANDPSMYPDASYNGINGTRANTSAFDVVRARIVVEGTALYQEFAYKLEGDFVGTGNDGNLIRDTVGGRKEPNLKDAYITWQPCEGWGTQFGQFRTFISRQFRTNDAYLQFADRSVASQANYLGWQQGIAQHGETDDGLIQGSVGVFNGISTNEGINQFAHDTNHTVIGSLRVNPAGKMDAFEEGDVYYTEDLALSFGAAYAYSEAHQDVGLSREEDISKNHVSADANMKYAGVSVHGEYFYQDGSNQHRSNGLDYAINGGYIQAGFFLEPEKWEIAGRYSIQDCDNGAAPGMCANRDQIQESAATINYYWWKHALKAQLGYAFINEDFAGITGVNGENEADTNRWSFQVSSYF